MFPTGGSDSDFHVSAQCREKFHEASNGKVTSPIPHQQRDLRLLHPENFSDLNLCHATTRQDRIDLQGELGLEQLLFGVWNTKICKDVSAALGHMSYALACFLPFGF